MKFRVLVTSFMLMILAAPLFAMQEPEEDVSKARLLLGPDRWIQAHAFVQAGFTYGNSWSVTGYETKDDAIWTKDFELSKARLVFNGQVAESVFFFFQTADLKAGASSEDGSENNANGLNNTFTQDAYVQFKPFDWFQVYAGLMALPFSRQSLTTDATGLSGDVISSMIPFENYSNNGRDTGIMLRGIILGKVEYRMGAFRGLNRKIYDNYADQANPTPTNREDDVVRNKNDMPRYTGRLQVNIFDAEEGYFYSDNYLGKRTILALGVGGDYQQDVCDEKNDGNFEDYYAMSADLSFDMGFATSYAANFQTGMIKGKNNPVAGNGYSKNETTGEITTRTGTYNNYFGYYAQAGFLALDTIQPWVRYTYLLKKDEQKISGTNDNDYKVISGGFNWFINGHYASVRVEYSFPLGESAEDPDQHYASVKAQTYF